MIPGELPLAGGTSVLFDAVVIAVSTEGAQQLAVQASAIGFIQDAFAHLKVIGHTAAAGPLLRPKVGQGGISCATFFSALATSGVAGLVAEVERF